MIDVMENKITEKKFYESIHLFINIIVWDMKIKKDEDYLKRKFFIYDKSFLKLLMLKLRLFIKYEDNLLYLSPQNFKILKLYLVSFLNNLPNEDYENPEFIDAARILFNVCSRIFEVKEDNKDDIAIEIIKKSLLSNLYDSFILQTQNFWKTYFSVEFFKSKELSSRQKATSVCESMVFYNFFLSKDMNFTKTFISKCVPDSNINFNSVAKTVFRMLNEHIIGSKQSAEIVFSSKNLKLNKNKKISKTLILLIKKGYINKERFCDYFVLDKETSNLILLEFIKHVLHNNKISQKMRRYVWVKYIKLKTPKEDSFDTVKKRELTKLELHQVNIDIKRTNGEKGEEYQNKLEKIILTFLEAFPIKIEYFQGFNYIVSFVFDFYEEEETIYKILNFITRKLLKVT